MTDDQRLNIDEVICLQMAGMSTPEIMRTDLQAFDRLYEQRPEFEEYLERINLNLDRQESLGIEALSCQDPAFPARLKAIGSDCPAMIYCLGNMELLQRQEAVAVIGARAADRDGLDAAYRIAADFARHGNVIVSGLALGCDTAAHHAALDVNGATIAVVATGLDRIHPHESVSLQAQILRNGGLILSEQPIGIKANPTRLIARNRLQAALSTDVILAQCPEHSGSMHTMAFARKYHKNCLAATFLSRKDANAGNYSLLDAGLAKPLSNATIEF